MARNFSVVFATSAKAGTIRATPMFTMRLTTLGLLSLLALLVSGCRSVQTQQKTGTAFEQDSTGRTKPVTYVTPEEYDRMTPEERVHQQVSVGVGVEVGGRKKSEPVSDQDLAKAMSNRK